MNSEELRPAPIRVETAFSRYPVHRLAKHGDIAIDIREKNESGETSIKWEVTHSPGPLAYKLDTLVVNRRIEEAPRPIPKIIKLGSLRDLCRELGQTEGENTNTIRNALRQNAFAGITAKIRYKQNDGTERTLKADFTRYSVVFTGEQLPGGRKADAVYIILNDIYMQVINGAMTRPLDYNYLKSLPPAPQRFYELLSYQMYAAIKNDRPRAKLLYSELCRYAPLARQAEWNQVRPQLARIHAPHKKSGYIARIDFQGTTDSDGKPDWIMLYQPGPKARAEFRTFTKRGGPVMLEAGPFSDSLPASELPSPLVAELAASGVTEAVARQLADEHGEDKIRLQLEILAWMSAKKPDKIADPAAWLVMAIKNGHAAPKGFVSKAEQQRRQEVRVTAERAKAEERRQRQQEEARERKLRKAAETKLAAMTTQELAELDAASLALEGTSQQAAETGPFADTMRHLRRIEHLRGQLSSEI